MEENSPMRYLSILLLLLELAVACTPQGNKLQAGTVLVSEQISNQQVLAFEQDASGHIWIGTARGLNKYDSRLFHQYFNQDDEIGLPDDHINDIFLDSKGRLWIATSGGACLYTRQGDFQRLEIEGTNTFLRQILELPDGRILFGSASSLGVLNEENGRIESALTGLFMSTFAISPDGSLWCTEFNRISRIDPASLEIEKSVPSPFKIYHNCITPDSTLWMSGVGHLATMDMETMEFKPLPEVIRLDSKLMAADVNSYLLCRDSTLLLNTTDDGLFLYDRRNSRLIHQDNPAFPYKVPEGRVNSLFEDSASNLWTGMEDRGFSVSRHFSPNSHAKRALEDYFRGKSVTCLYPQDAHSFWAGTAKGELYYCNLDNLEIRRVPTSGLVADPKGYMQINSLVVDHSGDVWLLLSSKWRALRCRFDGKALKVLQSFEILDPMSIAEDTGGNVWIGTLQGDVYLYKDGAISVASSPNPVYNSTLCILPLTEGGVLLGQLNYPLSVLGRPNGKVPGYLRKSALDSCLTRSVFYPTALLEDSRGDLWIGTIKNGLMRFSSGENRMEKIEGLSCSDVSAIREDPDGNIWISTLYGLCRYERESGQVSSFFESDGLGGSQFNRNSSCRMDGGTLIFGGTHGINIVSPGEDVLSGSPYLVFEDLKVFGNIVSPGTGQPITEALEYKPDIILPARMNGFGISFSALDYSGRSHIAYSYMLDGYDRYWVDAGRGNEAYYSNVPPGRYLFRLRGVDKTGGEVVASDSLQVRILPHPWLSPWAILAYILILSLIIALVIRTRRKFRQVRKEKEQAEEERLFLLGMVRDYQQKERVRLDFSDDGLTAADRAFLSDLTAIMQENITSPELDIDSITARLKISRAKFFYKVKKLTGETPGSFFRIFKLNRAATLLKEDKYNISEITDRTGFSSVSHFSTSFKKRYGVSPKEYKGNQ